MIKPYYQDEWVTIYNADCRDILPDLPKVDLVLSDPPYGIDVIGGSKLVEVNKYQPIYGDDSKIDLSPLFSVSKNQIIFGGNYFELPITKAWIIWDKKLKNNWNDNFSDGEMAWTSFDTVTRIFRCLYMGLLHPHEDSRVHPTQKPLELMRWIIENYSQVTDIILDPYMGSGSTLVACKELGRHCIGIEIEEKYCEIAAKRLSQCVLPLDFNTKTIADKQQAML
jgi:DNA modification methylase